MPWDPLILSRMQFAWVIAWHILLPAFTVGLAAYIAVLESLHAEAGGGSVDATLLLAEILLIGGRVAEAEALFDDLDLEALSVEERHAVTYGKALGRTRLGELSSVIAMITVAIVALIGDRRAARRRLQVMAAAE